ncbi:acyl carrier protein [Aquimarina aquimarini]|uniref:acyl carrier protein n=1 Tax=Aquimarina aquimarini TaxID=1191734 RepID=UPI000D559DC0|nr:acyl carrier protein [Aquimarina aquimarini]
MNTKEQLQQVFAKAFEIPAETITDQLEYQGIAEWDSMSHLVLVEEIETAYKVSIEMEDVLEMGSVIKVRDMLKKYGIEII